VFGCDVVRVAAECDVDGVAHLPLVAGSDQFVAAAAGDGAGGDDGCEALPLALLPGSLLRVGEGG
jgi:hypothetical protein